MNIYGPLVSATALSWEHFGCTIRTLVIGQTGYYGQFYNISYSMMINDDIF